MQKKLKLAVIAACCASAPAFAQVDDSKSQQSTALQGDQTFTFTESQLGEDDDMSQNVTIVSSSSNVYASEVGYLFSPVRFRYRAFDQKYNEIFINGAPMNDLESGQFRYSLVGGLNNQTRDVEFALPFESNGFSMSAMGGSNNYNFRPSHFAAGNRVAVSGANRNYTLRGMYTYNTGLLPSGWAFTGSLTYRWAKRGYVEGTFYNALSYFLGAEKVINDHHSISLVTWGNPTERATQGAATQESYWIANDNQYNPYWGYQNGKVRNSRIVNDFAPTALLTWDWKINNDMKLTTALSGKYSHYKSTKLNYNNADNPQPDYWKNLPSSYYDVWGDRGATNGVTAYDDWLTAYNYLSSSKANRQIDWDKLYAANENINAQGADAMYFIQAKNNDQLAFNFSSNLNIDFTPKTKINLGLMVSSTKGMHYQTMEDMLGAKYYHNINTYALGTYSMDDSRVQYDLNNPNASVGEGDRFGYDYNIFVNKVNYWTTLSHDFKHATAFISGRVGGTEMQREGNMRNGLAENNSYGKSGTAHFLDGGAKFGLNVNLGGGHSFSLGAGYEWKAPQASKAFQAPEINNDFVTNLKNEKVLSTEFSYQFNSNWLHASINGYYSQMKDVTEWQNFYFDDINSFSYVSMAGVNKEAYGVEWGLTFKVTSAFDINLIGTVSEAKNTNNATVRYMNSTKADITEEICYNKDMRESGTPLTALNLGLSYHSGGWYIDLNGNYYDRIYLSYSPSYRYQTALTNREAAIAGSVYDNDGNILESAIAQSKGKGGFMLDASIGRSIYLKKGSLSINLMVTNLLNNTKICTGGYEQSRSDYTSSGNVRVYSFSRNPKLFYAYGINGMLNITYKF